MRASSPAHYRTENSRSDLTRVELTWLEKRIEHWIRFGRTAEETIVNRRRRVVSFAPCRLRFRALGGQRLRDGRLEDRHRARGNGARIFSTLPFVRPGGEILLRIDGWPKVNEVLRAIDAVEACGVDPADAAPDHWRHVHNRLAAGEQPRPYSLARHKAWLLRRSAQ